MYDLNSSWLLCGEWVNETRVEARRDETTSVVLVRDEGMRDHRLGESEGAGRWIEDFSRRRSQTCVSLKVGVEEERGIQDPVRSGA